MTGLLPAPASRGGAVAEGLGLGAVLGGLAGAAVGMATGHVGLGAAVGAGVGGVGGGIWGAKMALAAPATPGSISIIVTPGAMTGISTSLSANPLIVLTPPPNNGSITGVASSNVGVVTQGQMSGGASSETVAAQSIGSATLTITWTDASGTAQTSTLPVTVTA